MAQIGFLKIILIGRSAPPGGSGRPAVPVTTPPMSVRTGAFKHSATIRNSFMLSALL